MTKGLVEKDWKVVMEGQIKSFDKGERKVENNGYVTLHKLYANQPLRDWHHGSTGKFSAFKHQHPV